MNRIAPHCGPMQNIHIGGTTVSAREEFIEIYTANIHREGADALLDYL